MVAEHRVKEGSRVLLTCKNGLSYAGEVLAWTTTPRGEPAVVVELDRGSGFSIMAPLRFVERLREVPIVPT